MLELRFFTRLLFLSEPQRDAGPNLTPVASFDYNYNLANQRTASTNVDNSYWVYQYDSLGQVVSGKKYWANGTPFAGQQFTYNFDTIGNRQSTASGGDATGSNLRTANYAANNLNEYTSRGIPSYAEISGSANANATVTVNLQRATRQGNYFWDELAVSNTTSPLWLALTNLAVLNNGTNADIIGTNQGNVFVKQTPEVFNYDADGNLTNDGRWAYTWDGENRLVKMTANTSVGPQYQLNFTYDAQSRRIQKIVATNGVAISTNNFVYDGWNLAAELNPNGTLVRSYIWGTDLSGSAQGAGGVGGLIAVSYHGSATTNCFTAFDGNGNIAALVNAADGSVSANYEYAPFGEVVRSTGPLARNNPFRFSTKYQDDESDLLYYGYRYYNASTGRWPNRDPLQEKGGLNLYGFIGNNPINNFDGLGMASPEQLVRVMSDIFDVMGKNAKECDCVRAYLSCVLGDLSGQLKRSGYLDALKQAVDSVDDWQISFDTLLKDSKIHDTKYGPIVGKLDDALGFLAKKAGGKAEALNSFFENLNKKIGGVTSTASTAGDLYDGDAVNATFTAIQQVADIGGKLADDSTLPLKPLMIWVDFYKDSYSKAAKALNGIQIDSLERALTTLKNDHSGPDCDEINATLGRSLYGPCKGKLGGDMSNSIQQLMK